MSMGCKCRPIMLLLLLLFGAFMPLPTAALCASAWLKQGSNLKLRLLPFLLEHTMMPGETRNVYLFDDSLQAAVSAAADTHACVGGLLMTGSGEPSELAMLLRVDSVKADCEYCSWARLSCIGRCRVSKVLKNKRHGYRVAVVSPLVDDAGSIAGIEEPVRAVHGRVAAQRRLLRRELIAADAFDSGYWESLGQSPSADIRRSTPANSSSELIFVGADKGRAPFGVYQSYESFEETGVLCDHVYMGLPWERPSALGCCYFNARDLGEIDDEENGAELDELIATRRAVLTTAAAGDNGSSPLRLLDSVGAAWGVQSEEAALEQLLSFAAAATLGPTDRARALVLTDTAERLELAQQGLSEQQELLANLLREHQS